MCKTFVILIALVCTAWPSPVRADIVETSYSCVVHVHSKTSGDDYYSLPELTDVARGYDVDAIFLTDNLSATIQLGLPPLRNVFWINKTFPSVASVGPAAYLDGIARENARQDDILYVPGVEMCPRFYWSGSLLQEDLVCHDHQRNLIVLGTHDADFLAKSPESCGYLWSRDAGWMIASRVVLALLVAACLAMLVLPRALAKRSSYAAGEIRKSFIPGLILPLLGVAAIINVLAARNPGLDIYGESASAKHAQRVLDNVAARELVHYWAHPEAVDHSEQTYAGLSFTVDTEPYPQLLSRTTGYTGFGGVYEDKNTVVQPGHEWDDLLMAYTQKKRGRPVWCFGEMLYHYEGQAGKKLGNVETMVWAPERTEEALLAGMKAGRFYARRNAGEQSLVLDTWRVNRAESGQTISTLSGEIELKIRVSLDVPANDVPLTVIVVSNGEQVLQRKCMAPFEDTVKLVVPDDRMTYYRVIVHGPAPLRLVSNPIFVLRIGL